MATETTTIKVVADTSQAERALSSLGDTIKGLASIAALTALARQFAQVSDAAANLQNKLSLVTVEGQQTSDLFKLMTASANRLQAPVQQVGDLFFQVANNSRDLQLSQRDQVAITESLIKGFQMTGQSMGQVQGSITQLGQAFGQGVLRGDELNSVMEGLPIVAQTLAKNLGVTTGALKAMGEQGRISSRDLADAILESGKALDEAYTNRIPTISGAFAVLSNTLTTVANNVNENTGLNRVFSYALLILAEAVISVAEWFDKWGKVIGFVAEAFLLLYVPIRVAKALFAALIGPIETIIGFFRGGVSAAGAFGSAIGKLRDYIAPVLEPISVLGEKIAIVFGLLGAGAAALGLNKLIGGIKDLFSSDKRTMAEKYEQKIKDINERLGVDQVKASEQALKANGGLTTQQVKNADAVRRANLDRETSFKGILRDQEASLRLTQFEGIELEYQQRINDANSKLIREIKNDKGEIIGVTQGLSTEEEKILRLNFEQTVQGRLQRDSKLALTAATQNLNAVMGVGRNLTSDQLDIEIRILEERRKSGGLLTKETEDRIRQTEELNKQLAYQRQIKTSLDAVNRPLGGAAAGAGAAGQLGSLDPVRAAMTANQTMFDGLKYLRDQDLISEQQYQNARVSATVQAQQAIFDATKKQYENEALLRIQAQTGQQFGLETQKQMAGQSAQFQMKTDKEKYAFALDQAAQMYTSLGSYNKKAFEAAKAFNIANAIMNTYAAATKALATYPFPFGLIAAAGAVAAGMAQVNAIRSQQFSGRALGGPVMNGQSYIVGERGPELFTPNTNGGITRNSDLPTGGTTNVNFTIVANDAQGFDDLLLQRRGMITQMISDAQLESGRRM